MENYKEPCGYEYMKSRIKELKKSGVEVFEIGKSVLNRSIFCVFLGKKGTKNIIIQGSIHAREHITIPLIFEQISAYRKVEKAFDLGVYFIPCVNPDGVELAINGLNSVKNLETRKELLKINNGSKDFSLYKANANGVDLNVNFDAKFGTGKSNLKMPAPMNYIGKAPFSEKETKALRDFTLEVKPIMTVSYHIKGEMIFWKFFQDKERLKRDYGFASRLSDFLGYPLLDGKGSAGGYKDWCVEKLLIPAFTIEAGIDDFDHPYPYSELYDILKKNVGITKHLAVEIERFYKSGNSIEGRYDF